MKTEIDLFENIDSLPESVKQIIEALGDSPDYNKLAMAKDLLRPLGYTFSYYLDATPYNLRKTYKTYNLLMDFINEFRVVKNMYVNMPIEMIRKQCELIKVNPKMC